MWCKYIVIFQQWLVNNWSKLCTRYVKTQLGYNHRSDTNSWCEFKHHLCQPQEN